MFVSTLETIIAFQSKELLWKVCKTLLFCSFLKFEAFSYGDGRGVLGCFCIYNFLKYTCTDFHGASDPIPEEIVGEEVVEGTYSMNCNTMIFMNHHCFLFLVDF